MLPSPQLIARFRRDFEALAGMPERLGLAVSGGPDSLALLLLAAGAFPGAVEAATVDHRLRSESTLEALHVEDICARIGCPHSILEVSVPDGPAGLQAEARAARYEALAAWGAERGITHLATAHHADDQAETVLMRLQRGSGVAGLGGIRPMRKEGALTLVRPLLGWRKAELVHVVSAAGIEPVDDPSNRDPRFDRAVVRRLLANHPQLEPERISRTAAAMREADEALSWAVERLWAERCAWVGDEIRLDVTGLPREMRRRLLSRAIGAIRSPHELSWTGGEDVEGLLASLEAGETATRAGVLATGGTQWRLRLAPPRRAPL
jgi:tRNA(Ile)-lysidine synthase